MCLKITSSESEENTHDAKEEQKIAKIEIIDERSKTNISKEDVAALEKKINDFESTLYKRVLDDARISLDSSKLATSLVSVASCIFVFIAFIFGFVGFREWKSISKVREKAERDIDLVRHFSLAEMYVRNGVKSKAIEEFEEVIKNDPNNLLTHTQLGFLYTDTFKDKAIEHCKKATELDRNNFTAYLNWGVNLDHTAAPKENVLEIYKIAERLGETQRLDNVTLGKLKRFIASSYESLGSLKLALGKYREAKDKLEIAKKSGLPDVVRAANYWLKDLDSKIAELEKK